MTLAQIIVILCWGIFLAYWFLNWRKVKPTDQLLFNGNVIRAIVIVIFAFLLINHFLLRDALNIPTCQWEWAGCHYQNLRSSGFRSVPIEMVSILLAFIGLDIAILARKALGSNWSSTLDVKKGHELITHGVYKYVRHPIYLGVLMMLLGTLLAFPTLPELITVLVVIAGFLYRVRREEAVMTKIFPKEYPVYKKRTKMLIPFIL